jgi:hypothetical protein
MHLKEYMLTSSLTSQTISQILQKLDTETSHQMLLALKVFKHTEPQ